MICRLALDRVRALPVGGNSHRLECRAYHLPPDRNPNGLPRPARIASEAVLRLGGDFHILARVLRPEPAAPYCLEVVTTRDMAQGRDDCLTLDDGLLSAIYHALARRHTLEKARRHARGEGRN